MDYFKEYEMEPEGKGTTPSHIGTWVASREKLVEEILDAIGVRMAELVNVIDRGEKTPFEHPASVLHGLQLAVTEIEVIERGGR